METAFYGLVVAGLVIWLVIALIRAQGKNTELARRIGKTEADLGHARQAFDALSARLWHVESALGELHRKARGEAASEPAAAAAKLAAAPTGWWKPLEGAAKASAVLSPGTPMSPFLTGAPVAAKSPVSEAESGTVAESASLAEAARRDETASLAEAASVEKGGSLATDTVAASPEGAVASSPAATGDAAAAPVAAPVAAPAPAIPPQSPPVSPYPVQPPMGSPAPAPKPPIEWERWIGVRGAAALGAGILVIAALYFFKYSLDQGLISPTMRVVMGTVVGIACVAGSERSLRAKHLVLANWLAGAGVAILYAAFWAAHTVYGLIGTVPAFGLMVAVTIACVLLAVRHGSLVTAVLGLLGGFITPFALSSGDDHPIALFGYLLLLDVALIGVARGRRWPILAALSLAGTWLYQVAWIAQRMGADRLALGIAIVVTFAAVFAIGGAIPARLDPAARPAPGTAAPPRLPLSQPAAVLVPFGFGLYFGLRNDLGASFLPVALLLVVLSAGACWVAYLRREGWVGLAAAAASVAVVFAWLVAHDPGPVAAQVIGMVVLLAVVFHVALELAERRSFAPLKEGNAAPASVPAAAQAGRAAAIASLSPAAAVASLGGLFLQLMAGCSPSSVSPWPWLAACAGLAALTLRHASFNRREPLHMGIAVLVALGLPVLHGVHGNDAGFPDSALYLGVCAGVAAVLLALSFIRRSEAGKQWASHAAALAALLLLVEPLAFPKGAPPAAVLTATLFFGLVAVIAATRLRNGIWLLAAMIATALVQTVWTALRTDLHGHAAVAWTTLVALLVSAVVFSLWPLLARRRFNESPWAWRAAALAAPIWFGALDHVWRAQLGDGAIGLLPVLLGGLSLGGGLAAWSRDDAPEPVRRLGASWFGAMAIAFAIVAVPLQLSNEGITLGWAIEALLLLILFRRLDHNGLKYTGLALFAVVTARLVVNPSVLEYHPHASLPVLNWLLYTYGVPVACLVAGWRVLGDVEVERLRPWEKLVYTRPMALTAMACGLAAIVIGFVWINLTILDAFNVGREIEILFEHRPARDLTLSIAWALYALALLALGMRRGSAGLRWASLVLILVTVGKVFLYDLGHLDDLYRVASLVGLALSLILISVAYQRLVFRKTTPVAPPQSPPSP